MAPVRGIVGHYYLADKLRYDAERWLATAIYDANGNFVGTFDPRLDSRRDVNYTGRTIEIGDYDGQPRPQVDPRPRGAGALLAVPDVTTRIATSAAGSIPTASISTASSRSRIPRCAARSR